MVKWVASSIKKLESRADSSWYPLAVGIVALADNFIFLVPVAGVAVTSILLAPKRWLSITLFIAIGNALGAALFAWTVFYFAPVMPHHGAWETAAHWFGRYGVWALFANSTLPVSDHPMLALAALSNNPMIGILCASVGGKLIKYFALAWLTLNVPGFFTSKLTPGNDPKN